MPKQEIRTLMQRSEETSCLVSINPQSYLMVKIFALAFNHEKALLGAFSVIVKSSRKFVASSNTQQT